MAPCFRFLPTVSAADSVSIFSKGFCEAKKFDISQIWRLKFDFVTGVGTAIITKSACFILDGSAVNVNSKLSSLSFLLLHKFLVFSSSMSNHITFRCLENASANGKPTYPNPTMETVLSFILFL